MDALREEIVEAQKVRTDLIKWKLVLVAALGATGLGLTDANTVPHAELVLCCIPFVNAYADALCHHMNLRVQVIGCFFHLSDSPELALMKDYEQLCQRVRSLEWGRGRLNAFALEQAVIPASSLLLSVGLVLYALVERGGTAVAILWSGVIGIAATAAIQIAYWSRRDSLTKLGQGDGAP